MSPLAWFKPAFAAGFSFCCLAFPPTLIRRQPAGRGLARAVRWHNRPFAVFQPSLISPLQ